MSYNQLDRVVYDADAHIIEPPTWLRDHPDPDIRDQLPTLDLSGGCELRQTGPVEEQPADLAAAWGWRAGPSAMPGPLPRR